MHNALELTRDDMQRWAKILGKKGWLGYGWPKEFGGPGWTAVQKHLFEEETALAGAPRIVPFGPVMVAPVIQAFGNAEQQQRFLPGIASGEVWWSQGYSEPGSGSDLASVKTRAERKGDKYIVNGQKTWTTLGQYGDWIFCLVRTSTEGKPQTGISFLLIDMKSPGVTVRPIKLMDGSDEVNEVWFDNVEVPAENLIGEENKGWTYAKHLLSHERTNIADVNRAKRELERLKRIAKSEGVWDDQRFRDEIAKLEVDVVALEMLVLRVLSAEKSGKNSLDIAGLLKIKGSEIQQRYSELMMLAGGPYSLPLIREAMEAGWQGDFPGGHAELAPLAIDLLQHAQDHHLRRQQRSAAQHRRADRAGLNPDDKEAMDFDFSDDQEQLRDAVRKWVDKGYDFERRRGIEAAGGFSREAWDELAELGLGGLYIPEDDGGMGMGPVEGMVVMEELGRGIVLEPLAQTLIAGGVLAGYADEAVKDDWLPRIAGGQALVVLAYQERKARYRLDVCEAQAAEGRRRLIALSGTKSLVPAGDQADAFIVPAQARRQDRPVPGRARRRRRRDARLRHAGRQPRRRSRASTRRAAALVTADGLPALEHAVDIGIAAACAEAVGVMDKTLAVTVEYMNTRKQFGVTIASFQALRHRVADMKMQLELARSMSYYATLKLNAPAAERRQAMARAKYQLGRVDALRRPARGAAAWRHRRDRRIHRQPLLQEADAAGNDLRRHACTTWARCRRACRTRPASSPERRRLSRSACSAPAASAGPHLRPAQPACPSC